jgi:Fic family protein
MDDFINFVNTEPDSLKKVAKIHYDFVKIHPFEDGNGRIARLLMNLYLVRMNIFPIIFPLSVRLDYIVSLKSSKSFDDFYNFFLRQLYENLKDYKRFLDKF